MKSRAQGLSSIFGTRLSGSNGLIAALVLVPALGAAISARSAETPQASTYGLLYSFQCGTDGGYPASGVILDKSGNLYGTTALGGEYGYGTVYKVTPSGTETVLHSFSGPPDGELPVIASLILDEAGNLYGPTDAGGQYGYGVIFKVTAAGSESVLYNFTGGTDGGEPYGGLVRDSEGNLYGSTIFGGDYGEGTVFKLTPGGVETVLHSFQYSSTDGAYPSQGLARDPAGNLYGTVQSGGTDGYGMVFKLTPGGVETMLHSFGGFPTDGGDPYAGGLLRDKAGNLYGATLYGGTTGDGVLYKVTPTGTETVLLSFNGGAGGGFPFDGLAIDSAGNLYGTAQEGGTAPCGETGCGVLFKLSTTGRETALHDFTDSSTDVYQPWGGVVRDNSGNLYGTAQYAGSSGCGGVFKFTP